MAGILDLVETSHLIVITRREHIASIRGKAIYAVREVAIIPLTSEVEARKAIDDARARLKKAGGVADGGDEDADDDDGDTASVASVEDGADGKQPGETEAKTAPVEKSTTSARDAGSKGYGGFAKRWFTRNNSKQAVNDSRGAKEEVSSPGQESEDVSPAGQGDMPATTNASESKSDGAEKDDRERGPQTEASKGKTTITSLTPRILRTAKLYFSTTGFFFSYDHDLSGSLTQRSVLTSESPLWKRFGDGVSSNF